MLEGFFTNRGNADLSEDTQRLDLMNALGSMNAEVHDISSIPSQLLEILSNDDNTSDKGISPEFLDTLERVDVKKLSDTDDCPICTSKFKDDTHPLIVKLPCSMKHSKDHVFDLDCIGPWLTVNSTCPLCRFDVKDITKLRRERLQADLLAAKDDEDEEEDWELYG